MLKCKRCESVSSYKAGFDKGNQRYHCKDCGYYYTDTPPRGKPARDKMIAFLLYAHGLSFRAIGKLLDVSHVSVQRWVDKLTPQLCPLPQPEKPAFVVEIDEVWHFLKKKDARFGYGKSLKNSPVALLLGNSVIVLSAH